MRVRGDARNLLRIVLAVVVIAATVSPIFMSQPVQAGQITTRSLTLQSGGSGDGGSKPLGVVNHAFDFTVPTAGDVGSVKFQYCTTASGTCTVPTGLVTDDASMTFSETGADGTTSDATGFTLVNDSGDTPAGTNGAPFLTRTAASVTAGSTLRFTLQGVTNPQAVNETFFVRISTYVSTDTSGTPVDEGTVAASTAEQIQLSGVMPESLIFCTGAAISLDGNGVPDCSTATSGSINFPQLFSPTETAYTTSEMAASTNAVSGYSITVNGATLTSGSNTIDAMSTLDTSKTGSSQFGMNLMDNTTPDVGAAINPTSNSSLDLEGQAVGDYAVADSYKFVDGDVVADSGFGGSTAPTNAQIYTVSYIVNVTVSQPAGTYTTTLTYICTPTF